MYYDEERLDTTTKDDQAAAFYCFLPMITQVSLIVGLGTTTLPQSCAIPRLRHEYCGTCEAVPHQNPVIRFLRATRMSILCKSARHSPHKAVGDLPYSREAWELGKDPSISFGDNVSLVVQL